MNNLDLFKFIINKFHLKAYQRPKFKYTCVHLYAGYKFLGVQNQQQLKLNSIMTLLLCFVLQLCQQQKTISVLAINHQNSDAKVAMNRMIIFYTCLICNTRIYHYWKHFVIQIASPSSSMLSSLSSSATSSSPFSS